MQPAASAMTEIVSSSTAIGAVTFPWVIPPKEGEVMGREEVVGRVGLEPTTKGL